MDEIIKNVKDLQVGYSMENRTIQILCYEDDATLIAKNEDNLQRLLYRFANTVTTFNMQMSIEKTQFMVISKELGVS